MLDGAILVLCAVGGVQSQSLTVDRQMKRYHIPRIAFINKMDRTGANPDKVIEQVKEKLGVTPLPLQIPMGPKPDFQGVIDLVEHAGGLLRRRQGREASAKRRSPQNTSRRPKRAAPTCSKRCRCLATR